MARYSFKKTERLTGKKNIEQLFLTGNHFKIKPFKILWQIVDKENVSSGSRLLISVPKKVHKLSVDRNLIKRRIRESYRINKEPFINFLSENNITVHWGVIYLSAEILPYKLIETQMILTLQQIIKATETNNSESN